MEEKPYIDEKLNTWTFVRTFKHDVLTEELVWHRDERGRYIEVLEGSGWEIQYENGLPEKLYKGDHFFIPAKTFHRIKRGSTDLVLKIEEFEEEKWQ
jgi:quercetin dioxygenase-like cupin family protein